ncbi:GAF domain-containing protein [Rhodococcus sp. SBT000017]|uniref:GAF domain-containing protein n=1 Tax=Rhodococcus sp. SBT000017 TaxID=1803385 RepID=UPI0011C3BCC4|nr:GAF domain-containing protein [Rhodococcus sp. SBT000017]
MTTDSHNCTSPADDEFTGNEWWVIETMGLPYNLRPTLVARGSHKRQFATFTRELRDKAQAKAILDIITRVTETGAPHTPADDVDANTIDRAFDTYVYPIKTDSGKVAGVQLWRGLRGNTPPPKRHVGTFEFDCTTQRTQQSRDLEVGIMGMPDHQDTRTLPQLWPKLSFDEREKYSTYMEKLFAGNFEPGDPFSSTVEVDIAGSDRRRLTYMTVRAITEDGNATPVVFGLVHDISDTPGTVRTDDREMTRAAVQLAKKIGGVGEIVMRTGYVCEWFRAPPGSLSRWVHSVPFFDLQLHHQLTTALDELLSGTAGRVKLLHGAIRFGDLELEEVSTEIELIAVGHDRETGQPNQCLIRAVAIEDLPAGMW